MATLADIACRTNVTPATVSRILRGSPGFSVSPAKREEVLAVALQVNYRPKRAARALTSGRTSTVAVVLGDMEKDFASPTFSVVMTEMIRWLWSHHHATTILPVDPGKDPDDVVLDTIRESHADAYFIPNMYLRDKTLREIHEAGVSVVSFSAFLNPLRHPGINYIELDELGAVRELARLLVELNHQSVLCFGSEQIIDLRYHVLQQAVAQEKAALKPERLAYNPARRGPLQERDQARVAVRALWDQIRHHTAVLCSSDSVALGFLDVLAEKGLTPGRDMTVVGQDNLEENPSYQLGLDAPVLTTVDRNPAGRGRMIAELLLDRIRSAPDAAAVVRQVPLKLIHRKTHGPARQPQPEPTRANGRDPSGPRHACQPSLLSKGPRS